ncbi:hydrogenase expression/formation protein HypE, partial [bacterium]|nr:hydrogenase expression/formation protein HypE [bacterium]
MAEIIGLGAGGGGGEQRDLIEQVRARLSNPLLDCLEDAALLPDALAEPGAQLVFTTDSYVVHPWRFPGGDVGKLAVCGTVNDLAV